MRHARAILLTVCACGLIVTACGGGASGPRALDGTSLTKDTSEEQKLAYDTTMERMRSVLEDPSSPPPERAIVSGNRTQLLALARRWDEATQVASSADPPKDIAAQHTKMVHAMRELGFWNHRIADAAPNAKRTKALGAQAKASPAARAFGTAVGRIESAGYAVLTVGDPEDPFNDAGAP